MKYRKLFLLTLEILTVTSLVSSHGRLIDPPARSTAWRYGYDTPVNYDDNQLYCGGVQAQWQVNGGKCGICGDQYDRTRDHETPNGKYTKPLRITGHYASGSILEATVELTTTHLGYFMFRLCPETSATREVTQECLDKYVLKVLDKNVHDDKYEDKYFIKVEKSSQVYLVQLRLTPNVTCDRCVLQWTYTTGNTWGSCDDGTQELGCGPQETFRGCSDIKIYPRESISQKRKKKKEKNNSS